MAMYRFIVHGIVQGVGFRPYIYRKAKAYGLVGSVKNIGSGVEIIVNDKNFLSKLSDLPPLAKISGYSVKKIKTAKKYLDFQILESRSCAGETIIPADIFMCTDCLKELRDRGNRRHNYYFITCTNCGPRFSIIEDYPYDRPLTSMRDYEMCDECRREYINPLDRRYHAQTIACKNCGPKLLLKDRRKNISGKTDSETIKKASDLLKAGEVVAVKGVGGFHLCSLTDEETVSKVRKMLGREDKPFAVMVRDIKAARKLVFISEKEEEVLESPARPIVVLKKKNPKNLLYVSELDSLGLMLPYTALHYLLFDYLDEPLLMTSCNLPGEPVVVTEKIARYFLTHERRIVNRCDDSVIKVIGSRPFFLRRSRGFAPMPVKLPINCRDTLALGAQLNNVMCAAKKNQCFLSQYIGETSKYETFNFLKDATEKMVKLTRLKPEIIACDLHPTYNSTAFAAELSEKYDAKLIKIQHHKSHVAGVAAEHNLSDYVGIAVDGLGYGEDGLIWGGEVFEVRNRTNFKRIGHLEEQPQLGGDSATIQPKKMLFGILSNILSERELMKLHIFKKEEAKLYLKQLSEGFNVPYTTSTGRILDAVAAFIGICDRRTYDGRPAMLLESVATKPFNLEPEFLRKDGKKILSTTNLFRFLLDNREKEKGRLAATAQTYLAYGLYEIAEEKNKPVVVSGGVAYNRMISSFLMKKGVLFNKEIPAGDGGTCYGQAYLANLLS